MLKYLLNLFKKKCNHKDKEMVFINYQDAYVEWKCNSCGEHVLTDL